MLLTSHALRIVVPVVVLVERPAFASTSPCFDGCRALRVACVRRSLIVMLFFACNLPCLRTYCDDSAMGFACGFLLSSVSRAFVGACASFSERGIVVAHFSSSPSAFVARFVVARSFGMHVFLAVAVLLV